MKLIKYFFAVLLILTSFISGAWLVASNTQQVSLDFFGMQLPTLGISIWLLIAIGLGFVLGFIANLGVVLLLKNTQRRTQKALKIAEQKLNKLQGIQ